MSISARSTMMLAAAATGLTMAPAAALAQDRTAVLNILVECAKIDDPSARLACYDNNMKSVGAQARANVPGTVRGVTGGGAPIAATGGSSGFGFGGEDLRQPDVPAVARSRGDGSFGSEDILRPDRFETVGPQQVTTTVASVQQREPGIFLMTMQDDTQWVFAEGARNSFRPPRSGSKVEIDRGALGSFLARVDGQEPVRVRRLR